MDKIEIFVEDLMMVWREYPTRLQNLYHTYSLAVCGCFLIKYKIFPTCHKLIKSIVYGLVGGAIFPLSLLWMGEFHGTRDAYLPVLILCEVEVFVIMKKCLKKKYCAVGD